MEALNSGETGGFEMHEAVLTEVEQQAEKPYSPMLAVAELLKAHGMKEDDISSIYTAGNSLTAAINKRRSELQLRARKEYRGVE